VVITIPPAGRLGPDQVQLDSHWPPLSREIGRAAAAAGEGDRGCPSVQGRRLTVVSGAFGTGEDRDRHQPRQSNCGGGAGARRTGDLRYRESVLSIAPEGARNSSGSASASSRASRGWRTPDPRPCRRPSTRPSTRRRATSCSTSGERPRRDRGGNVSTWGFAGGPATTGSWSTPTGRSTHTPEANRRDGGKIASRARLPITGMIAPSHARRDEVELVRERAGAGPFASTAYPLVYLLHHGGTRRSGVVRRCRCAPAVIGKQMKHPGKQEV